MFNLVQNIECSYRFFRIKGSLEHSNIFRKLDRLNYFVWKQFCEDFVSFEKHFIEKSVSLNFENLNTISSPRLWVQTLSSASLLSRIKVSNKVVKNYVKKQKSKLTYPFNICLIFFIFCHVSSGDCN